MATQVKIYSNYKDLNLAVDEINKQYRKLNIESARRLKAHTGCKLYFKSQIYSFIQDLNYMGYQEVV